MVLVSRVNNVLECVFKYFNYFICQTITCDIFSPKSCKRERNTSGVFQLFSTAGDNQNPIHEISMTESCLFKNTTLNSKNTCKHNENTP